MYDDGVELVEEDMKNPPDGRWVLHLLFETDAIVVLYLQTE